MALVLVPSLGCPCFSILLKVAFFQKVRFIFQISQSPKKIFQKTILNLKFKIPTHNIILLWGGILNFKFRIVFWNIFFWDWEIWKMNRFFWKKKPFSKYVVEAAWIYHGHIIGYFNWEWCIISSIKPKKWRQIVRVFTGIIHTYFEHAF